MTKRMGMWIVIGLLVAYPAMGYAAEHGGKTMAGGHKMWTVSLTPTYTASPWTKETEYASRAGGKLVFGLKNALLGWTEIFTESKAALDRGDNLFVGLGKGLVKGVAEELGGAVHLATFPLTCLDAPLPGGGTHLL